MYLLKIFLKKLKEKIKIVFFEIFFVSSFEMFLAISRAGAVFKQVCGILTGWPECFLKNILLKFYYSFLF